MGGMSDPTTNRRSILAAGIAALLGLWRGRSAPIRDTWEHSVTTSVKVDPGVYVFPKMPGVELESGGTILMCDLLTCDDEGRAVTWRETSKRPIIGMAKEGALPGKRFLALLVEQPSVDISG